MPPFDPTIPASLLAIQQWFSSVITRPIDQNSQMQALRSGEAAELIAPSLTLNPDQRIQIYSQQYWWRLLSCLQENFPALTRLFGYSDFNKTIAVPFLLHHPSVHWSLAKLGHLLPAWLNEHYEGLDKALVVAIAELDFAHLEVFFAPSDKALVLLRFPFDLIPFRKALLEEEVEFWLEEDFPPLTKDKTYYYLLYREAGYQISYQEVCEGEWTLLDMTSRGDTINV